MTDQATTTVKKEADRVWLDGVKGFSPAEFADSVHGAQARILEALGEPITYANLLGWSGFAFRVNIHEQMCPSGGHPCCGYQCLGNAFRALPWKATLYESFPWSKPKKNRKAFEAEVRKAVRRSINAGIPVHYGSEEDGLIIGYGDDGERWLCLHPYCKGGHEPFWHDEVKGQGPAGFAGGKWPWAVTVWNEPKPAEDRVDAADLTKAALQQAVDMWNTEKRDAYLCGKAAYAHWLEWLRGVDADSIENPKAGMQGNGWCFDVLIHSRRIAGEWLAEQAGMFQGHAQAALRTASEHYAAVASECMAGLDCPWDLAPGPEQLDKWTPDMRREQIARLVSARGHDAAAIVAIGKAMA